MLNALAAVQGGLQARETAFQGQAQEGYRNALAQYGMNAPETRTAFASVNPVAANAMNMQDQERRDKMIGQVARTLAGMPADVQARMYPQFASQLKASGVQLGKLEQYPGPEAIQTAAMLYALPAAERTEFERLVASLPEDQRSAAIAQKLGITPSADTVFKAANQPDPLAALRLRASEAGLLPGTPEYQDFMRTNGEAKPVTPRTDIAKLRADLDAGLITQPEFDRLSSGLTAVDPAPEGKLRTEFAGLTKEFRQVADSYTRIQASKPDAAGDLSLIFQYMKMLDPGSAVREQEFANAQNAAGVPDQVRNLYNQLMSGERLNPDQREMFKGQASALFSSAQRVYDRLSDQYRGLASQYNFDPDRVVIPYGADTGNAAPVADLPTFDALPEDARQALSALQGPGEYAVEIEGQPFIYSPATQTFRRQ